MIRIAIDIEGVVHIGSTLQTVDFRLDGHLAEVERSFVSRQVYRRVLSWAEQRSEILAVVFNIQVNYFLTFI